MLKRLRTHNFGTYICTIGGVLIGGYADDGGVDFEWAADTGEDTIGADGEVVYAPNNDDRAYATIKQKQTAAGYARLMALITLQRQQIKSGVGILPLPFESFNPSTLERVFSEYCVFKERPTPSENKAPGDRETGIFLPYAKHFNPVII